MPTVGVKKRILESELGKTCTDEDLEKILFDYGLELDGIETTKISDEGDYIYKIEVPANRYDLLCAEGLGRALRIFKGLYVYLHLTLQTFFREAAPKYEIERPKDPIVLKVEKSVSCLTL